MGTVPSTLLDEANKDQTSDPIDCNCNKSNSITEPNSITHPTTNKRTRDVTDTAESSIASPKRMDGHSSGAAGRKRPRHETIRIPLSPTKQVESFALMDGPDGTTSAFEVNELEALRQ